MFVDITQQCFALLPEVNFPANNLNFHWRWRDPIQAIFLNLFYFKPTDACRYTPAYSLCYVHCLFKKKKAVRGRYRRRCTWNHCGCTPANRAYHILNTPTPSCARTTGRFCNILFCYINLKTMTTPDIIFSWIFKLRNVVCKSTLWHDNAEIVLHQMVPTKLGY